MSCRRLAEQPIELITRVPHNRGRGPIDKDVEKKTEAEKIDVSPSAGVDAPKQAEGTIAEKGVLAPSADAPKDDETIDALKDIDGRHVDDEEDIICTKEVEGDDDETLAKRKARQEKQLALKKVGQEPLNVAPISEFNPKTGMVLKLQPKSISIQLHFANPDDFPASLTDKRKRKKEEEESSDEPSAPLIDKRKRKKDDQSDINKAELEKQKKEKKSKRK